jgi:LysR family hydrogen peroxide-inducible transcriptional activator
MAVKAGLLNGTDVQARPLNAEHASREIALVWRTNSPRREEFELLADALRGLHAA